MDTLGLTRPIDGQLNQDVFSFSVRTFCNNGDENWINVDSSAQVLGALVGFNLNQAGILTALPAQVVNSGGQFKVQIQAASGLVDYNGQLGVYVGVMDSGTGRTGKGLVLTNFTGYRISKLCAPNQAPSDSTRGQYDTNSLAAVAWLNLAKKMSFVNDTNNV